MSEHAFPMVKIAPGRSREKPRRTGLTMMVDWGVPLRTQEALLEMSGAYLDLAKLAVVSVRVYTEKQLRSKVALYREHGVRSFIGGGAIERMYALEGPGVLEPFFREAVRVGIEVIEISDNYITLTPEERRRQIALARSCGLTVFGEIGSKHEKSDAAQLVSQANDCFEAGAEIVIVEGYELVDGREPKRKLIDDLRRGIDPARTLYELPGPWISGINASDVQDLKKILIREFGPDVSLGNVMPDDLFETEMSRQGFGVVQPTTLSWQ